MTDPTEQVAEAIYEADRQQCDTGKWWAEWSHLAQRHVEPHYSKYLAMARAAIDALQLTEETRKRFRDESKGYPHPLADQIIESRLVGPWVEGSDQ